MWTRSELKSKAKIAFKANYWKYVFVSFIASLLAYGAAANGASDATSNDPNSISNSIAEMESTGASPLMILSIIGGVSIVVLGIALLMKVFVYNPLLVGCDYFFLRTRKDTNTDLKTLNRGFKPAWGNVAKTMFVTNFIISVCYILLIVPGIIKQFQYLLVPYILAENPEIDSAEARRKSKELMQGNKWAAFVLDLSFIGWFLLAVVTFGLVGLFYLNPYMEATHAELYAALAHPELER